MLKESDIKELKLLSKGKVRDIYELDENLLIITTDRVSAFDYVLENTIPYKGIVLNLLSLFFFEKTGHIIRNHILEYKFENLSDFLKKYDYLKDRFVIVKKAKPFPVECIVRGYITGSAWSEYKKSRTIGGVHIDEELKEFEKFSAPIFTPSTKAEHGFHDENISSEKMKEIIGHENASKLKELTINLYDFVYSYAYDKGIIIVDTKLEFGLDENGIILIDEMFTPDSSRFWFKDEYLKNGKADSYDKQYIRDYLLKTGWDKISSPPRLSDEIVEKTSQIYKLIYKMITGNEIS